MPHSVVSVSAALGSVNAFSEALAAVERFDRSQTGEDFGATEVSLREQLDLVKQADWVVIGDIGIPPASYTRFLREVNTQSDETAVVWDWQPPLLSAVQTTSYGVIDRRPYLAIAQLPASLRRRMEHLVHRLSRGSAPDAVRGEVLSLIQVLGTRGLGYSRLLKNVNKYHTFEKGALGLAVSLSLIDEAAKGWRDAVIIPLDAAHPFLRSMGSVADRTKMADLLLLVLGDGERELVLLPVEVKMYGSEDSTGAAPDQFPGVGADVLKKPISQVEETQKLLQSVVDVWDDARRRSSALLPLFAGALASLMDIGIRTRPSSSGDEAALARGLQALAAGDLPLRVGHGVVMYYTPATARPYEIRSSGTPRFAFMTPEHAYLVHRAPTTDPNLCVALQDMLRGAAGFGDSAPPVAPAPPEAPAPQV
jgi:hypothetical protein